MRIWIGERLIAEAFVGDSSHTQGTRVTTRDTDGDGIADVLVTVRGSQAFTIASSEVRTRTLIAQPFDEIALGAFVG